MLVIATIVSITGVALGLFFLVYGYRAGIRRGRILERAPDGYAECLRARARGGLYVVIGIAFLLGSRHRNNAPVGAARAQDERRARRPRSHQNTQEMERL
jgi:hypothetical protein